MGINNTDLWYLIPVINIVLMLILSSVFIYGSIIFIKFLKKGMEALNVYINKNSQ